MRGRWIVGLVLAVPLAGALGAGVLPPAGAAGAEDLFERGVSAYRRGDYGEARTLWLQVLDTELSSADRARVLYDLGNASWRLDERFEAVGWYTASVRLAPRQREAWANLELARAETGLEPADRGDLDATVRRLLGAVTLPEARRLALVGVLLLALVLLAEALVGGRLLAWGTGLAFLLALALAAPWAYRLTGTETDPLLVVRPTGADLRSEPRRELPSTGRAEPGEIAERIDALPGWVRLERADGSRGWTPEDGVFALDR